LTRRKARQGKTEWRSGGAGNLVFLRTDEGQKHTLARKKTTEKHSEMGQAGVSTGVLSEEKEGPKKTEKPGERQQPTGERAKKPKWHCPRTLLPLRGPWVNKQREGGTGPAPQQDGSKEK